MDMNRIEEQARYYQNLPLRDRTIKAVVHLEDEEDKVLEKAFKEGYEHGYKKAMRDLEEYNERGHKMSQRINYREGFEEKIERLKKKFE
jgi:flagellar biosynthesis/type III secretory pathway protein FliH